MTENFNDDHRSPEIRCSNKLDEILFRNPPNAIQRMELENGVTKLVEIVTFADGSKLAITAQVPVPPMADMTPSQVFSLKLNGEKCWKSDEGTGEVDALARQSTAVRLMARISHILDGIPEAVRIKCPACEGQKHCQNCGGSGCSCCSDSGACPECGGRGFVLDD